MKMLPKARLRLIGFAATGLILIFTLACINRPMKNAIPDPIFGSLISIPQSAERDVDMLFVIDNSGSMAGEQAILIANFSALMAKLKGMAGGLPNVHLGVTSTDLGTGMFQITYCEEVGGDAGNLMTGNCVNPTGGAPYIIDVEPQSCEITKDTNNDCSAHTCGQTNCAHEPTTTFVEDSATGCPRCRNYSGESLEDVFSCVANLGTMGCGFEQPLESMRKALDNNASNTGFIRENAFLAVLLITDEDDCSASNPQLYDNTQTDINSTLGPLTSYRCFEYGITCDVNSRTHQGTRVNCIPRDDAAALLHPLSIYVEFLQALKDPQMLVVAAIAGPVTPSTGEKGGHNMVVGLDELSNPELQYSCTTTQDGAVPGIRIWNLIASFNDTEDMPWAYSSICQTDYTVALEGVGNKIKDILEFQCLPSPLKGCADVGIEFGVPRAAQTCAINEQCLAECVVTDVFNRGVVGQEEKNTVIPCLHLLPDGSVDETNIINESAYANGHPNERDANLPGATSACWHISYQENCPGSNYAEIIISRKADPPPRSFTEVACRQIPRDEQLCNDQKDNDEDCLVDHDDPCCQSSANCVE